MKKILAILGISFFALGFFYAVMAYAAPCFVNAGCTGQSNVPNNSILLGSSTNQSLKVVSAGSNGTVLSVVAGVPTYVATSTLGFSSNTSILPLIANGSVAGVNATSAPTSFLVQSGGQATSFGVNNSSGIRALGIFNSDNSTNIFFNLNVTGTSTLATTTINGTLTVPSISNCNSTQFLQITSGLFGCGTPSGGVGGSGVGSTSPFTAGFIPEATGTNVTLSNSNIFQTTAGLIGINTTTPTQALQLASGNLLVGTSSSGLQVNSFQITSTNSFGNIDVTAGTSGGSVLLQAGTTGEAQLFTQGHLGIIVNGGLVGINTSTPAYQLDVYGSGTTNPFNVSSSSNKSLLNVAANGSTTISSLTAGCVAATSGGSLYIGNASGCSGGGGVTGGTNGKVAVWTGASTLSSGDLLDNLTVSGVNATSSTVNFNIQGTGTLNPFNVSSSSGTSLFTVLANGTTYAGNANASNATFLPGKRMTVSADTLYNDGQGAFQVQSGSNPLYNINFGYDQTNGFGYIQSDISSVGASSLVLNPNGGKVSIGFVAGSVPNSDFQIDHIGSLSGTYGSAVGLWLGDGDPTLGRIDQLGFGAHSGVNTVPTAVFGAITSNATNASKDFVWALRPFSDATQSAPLEVMRLLNNGSLYISTLGTNTPSALLSVQSSSTTEPTALIKGTSTQTSDLVQVASSTGTTLFGVTSNGWQYSSGPTPAISSCGTGTGTDAGNDNRGTITTATAATACTMTLSPSVPAGFTLSCTVTDDSLVGFADISSTSTTAVVFGISSALTGGHLFYNCGLTK